MQGGEGQTFLHSGVGDKHFMLEAVVDSGHGDIDVDEEMDMSKAKLLMSEGSKLSIGSRIFRGP